MNLHFWAEQPVGPQGAPGPAAPPPGHLSQQLQGGFPRAAGQERLIYAERTVYDCFLVLLPATNPLTTKNKTFTDFSEHFISDPRILKKVLAYIFFSPMITSI